MAGTAAAAATCVAAVGAPAPAAPGAVPAEVPAAGAGAGAALPGPHLLSVRPAVLRAAVPTWLETRWLTINPVCDFRLTAAAPGVQVAYPADADTYTSFQHGDRLDTLETDHAALRVTVAEGPAAVPLRLQATYVRLPDLDPDPDAPCTGTAVTSTITVPFGVLPA